ncbi:MAG: hypothetical protein AAFV53_37210 [Myxococcota bacterium]
MTDLSLPAGHPALPDAGLTLYPEWIIAIFWLGKDIENRSWAPSSRLLGKRLAFSAGKSWGGEGRSKRAIAAALIGVGYMAEEAGWVCALGPDPRTDTPLLHAQKDGQSLAFAGGPVSDKTTIVIQPGRLYGDVILLGHTLASPSPWAVDGQVHWQISKPRLYPAPIPVVGKQGIWKPADRIRKARSVEKTQAGRPAGQQSLPGGAR